MNLPAAGALVIAALLACDPAPTDIDYGRAGDGTLANQLASVRDRFSLPALGALLLEDGRVVERAVVGVRATGLPQPASVDDRWHLGSLTKAMTATLAARLVEQGRVSWDVTVGDVFPDLVGTAHAQYVDVSLAELFRHTSGLPVDLSRAPSWSTLRESADPVTAQRRRVAGELLSLPPETIRGQYLYTNAGYIVAGAMLEQLTGEAWEALMRREVFDALAMSTAGFGAPGTAGARDQPRGHRRQGASWLAIEPGIHADNPAALGPAGTVHASLADYARFMAVHLAGARGASEYLEPASFERMHTPLAGDPYALGWGVEFRDWAAGRALSHAGSNTLWFAVVWVAPNRNLAMVAVTNAWGHASAVEGVAAVIDLLLARHDR